MNEYYSVFGIHKFSRTNTIRYLVFVNLNERIVFGIRKFYEQIVFGIWKFYEWIVFSIYKYLGPNSTDIFLFKGHIWIYWNILEHAIDLNIFISRLLDIRLRILDIGQKISKYLNIFEYLLRSGTFWWTNTIRYSVFEKFHEQILFGIRYSEIFYEQILFGIWYSENFY